MKLDVPVLKQEWENSCGPTALAMVLQFYHENISEKDIRKTLNMSIDDLGVTPLQLGNVARKVGFVADVEDSCDIPTIKENLSNGVPAIVLIDQGYFIGEPWIHVGHFVVVTGIDETHIYLNDPELGERKEKIDEFKKAWELMGNPLVVLWRKEDDK